MPRFAKAIWHGPVPNLTPGGMVKPIQGLVMHVMQGTMVSTDSWFHQSVSQVSAHFGNPKTGPLWQWVDTADEAWAEAAGNPHWISVEHEGDTGESLTASQIVNDAELFAWLHIIYPIPLQLANNPNENGLGYHAMGGVPWGNHPSCPGAPIIAQRAEIVAAAIELVTPKPPKVPEDEMEFIAQGPTSTASFLYDTQTRTRKGISEGYNVTGLEAVGIKNYGATLNKTFLAGFTLEANWD